MEVNRAELERVVEHVTLAMSTFFNNDPPSPFLPTQFVLVSLNCNPIAPYHIAHEPEITNIQNITLGVPAGPASDGRGLLQGFAAYALADIPDITAVSCGTSKGGFPFPPPGGGGGGGGGVGPYGFLLNPFICA